MGTNFQAAPLSDVSTVTDLDAYVHSGLLPKIALVDPQADNDARVVQAGHALVEYAKFLHDEPEANTAIGDELTTLLADLFGDLLHLADAIGQDPAALLQEAQKHHDFEIRGEI